MLSRMLSRRLEIDQESEMAFELLSLRPEWNTHAVVWINKADIETMSIDEFGLMTNSMKLIWKLMDLKRPLSVAKYVGKKECRAPRNKEGQFKYQDNTRKQGNNEDTSSKAMLAIDGVGFYWSDMAEEQVQTNMDLMAFSESKLESTKFTVATYKRGLATVEDQLITYRNNEVLFSEEVAVLKRGVTCKDYEINVLKSKFEKVKQEKEGIEFKIKKFDNA
ncbi:hypothetical protein Tco_0483639 [Tanacetum coccineum]